ncbi:hypothetical protein Forpe1208_v005736 [Fusarium oxysporum f. sp. rapae]|uniref:Uncharacterized protein n=1 Tax=Fusarium oxysporum f. sp. rapae TaxID=485398 RepID=A0A8J5NZ06_FUSOX|nr:hypothetical protein Forpe1208_v005736 [Fusarium oxysporum f. sp. rapae]
MYATFLSKRTRRDDDCTFVYDQRKAIEMIFTIAWTNEGDDFIFQNEQDAASWERIVSLCSTSTVSPPRKCITKELRAVNFRRKLRINEQEWSEVWHGAVLSPIAEISAKSDAIYVDTTTPAAQEGAKIRRSVGWFGSWFSIRVPFSRLLKNNKKGQNDKVANEATPVA